MTYKEIMAMIHNACCKVWERGSKDSKDTVIQCATQIYIAQMDGNNEGDQK